MWEFRANWGITEGKGGGGHGFTGGGEGQRGRDPAQPPSHLPRTMASKTKHISPFDECQFKQDTFQLRVQSLVLNEVVHMKGMHDAIHIRNRKVKHLFLGINSNQEFSPQMPKSVIVPDAAKALTSPNGAKQSFTSKVKGVCSYCIQHGGDNKEKPVKCIQVVLSEKEGGSPVHTFFFGICEAHLHDNNEQECIDFIYSLKRIRVPYISREEKGKKASADVAAAASQSQMQEIRIPDSEDESSSSDDDDEEEEDQEEGEATTNKEDNKKVPKQAGKEIAKNIAKAAV
eukprot:382486-Hanusia_phi.AAC.2